MVKNVAFIEKLVRKNRTGFLECLSILEGDTVTAYIESLPISEYIVIAVQYVVTQKNLDFVEKTIKEFNEKIKQQTKKQI